MGKSKKYYWLKLKDDFFNNKEIKKLRKIAGGDTYIIIYLKMQLLSIKKGGIIKYEQTEENLAEQLSLEIDESEENIKMVLSFMKANNLIEDLTIDEYLLTKVPPLIGKETDAAERMRRMRERNNVTQIEGIINEKCNNVTPMLQSVTQRKEIEKREKKKEVDEFAVVDKIIDYFNQVTGKSMKHKKSSREPISARLKEGFTFEDAKAVIDWKYKQWKDDFKMSRYIKISTLFAPSHFEEYLQEDKIIPTTATKENILEGAIF